jgi:hypothetical protein
MAGWLDLITVGVDLLGGVLKYQSANSQADAARSAGDSQANADITFAHSRAIFSQEQADLEASLLRMAGDAAHDVGEFNARIYEGNAEVALKLATREKAIITDNAQIQKVITQRKYATFQSSQVAAVGGAGITLSGSALYVMLDSAAEADYTFAVQDWNRDVAVENRDITGNLEAWQNRTAAVKERYMGDLNRALKYKEADVTQELGALAAKTEEDNAAAQADIDRAKGDAAGNAAQASGTSSLISGIAGAAAAAASFL